MFNFWLLLCTVVCTACDDIVAMCMHAFVFTVVGAQCDDVDAMSSQVYNRLFEVSSSDSVQPKIAKPKRGGGVGRRQLDIFIINVHIKVNLGVMLRLILESCVIILYE